MMFRPKAYRTDPMISVIERFIKEFTGSGNNLGSMDADLSMEFFGHLFRRCQKEPAEIKGFQRGVHPFSNSGSTSTFCPLEVTENKDFIQSKREVVSFSPNDKASVGSFLQEEKINGDALFTRFYALYCGTVN